MRTSDSLHEHIECHQSNNFWKSGTLSNEPSFVALTESKKLWKCILWYQKIHRNQKNDPVVSRDLAEDVLIEFEGNVCRIPVVGGAGLEHIFSILHANSNDLKNRLADSGISTFDDVLKHKNAL